MKKTGEKVFGVCFAGIPVLGFLIFGLIPIVAAIVMSFMKIKGYNFDGAYGVGLQNYVGLVGGEFKQKFWLSIGNSFIELIALPVQTALALVISVFLNRGLRGTKFFRTVFFVPYVCSVVAIMTMWKWIYEENFGILNQIITALGGEKIGFISDSDHVRASMLVTCIWGGVSLGTVLYSAAINNVSKTYYEAARIDGAGELRMFFQITFPAVSPTTFYLLVTGAIGYLQDFVRYQTMLGPQGGPSDTGLTMVFYLWQMSFLYNPTMGVGYSCAMAMMIAVIIAAITGIQYALQKAWVTYDF